MSNNINVLGNDFNNLVSEYQNTYEQFIKALQKSENTEQKSMNIINNASFTGNQILDTFHHTSVHECRRSCENSEKCSGATFHNEKERCILNQGNGDIIKSSNESAIVKEALYYSYKLQNINEQLKHTNEEMMELTNDKIQKQDEVHNNHLDNSHILQTNYNALEEDKMKIEQIIRQYETLNSAYENGNIHVSSNYFYFILFMIIAIVLTVVLFVFGLSSGQKGGGRKSKKYLFGIIFGIFAMYILYNTKK